VPREVPQRLVDVLEDERSAVGRRTAHTPAAV
jgi:hypothetical protein